jgi:glycerophosphoryl diester phosphodiesterase
MLRTQFVAHRGYQKLYPENTLLSHQKAIDAGALYLETDVQLSADLLPVLYHDAGLKRVSGCAGRVSKLPYSELCDLSAYEPKRLGTKFISEKIASLANFVKLLERHTEITAYIEVKSEAVAFAGAAKTFTVVHDCIQPVANRCFLISSNLAFISHARHCGWQKCGVILSKWRDLNKQQIKDINPDTIFCQFQKIPRGLSLLTIKPELVLYEITTPQQAAYWLDRGASKVETFEIGNMIKI